jgi:hypothetical protein
MQARDIAAGRNAVYAISASGAVSVIERGADGLWGRWQATSVLARSLVHAGSLIGRIGPDGRVSVFEQGIWRPPHEWDREARELSGLLVPGHGPTLLAVDRGAVWSTWKPSPAGAWEPWRVLEAGISGLDATPIPGAGPAIFGVSEGSVHWTWQGRPLGG